MFQLETPFNWCIAFRISTVTKFITGDFLEGRWFTTVWISISVIISDRRESDHATELTGWEDLLNILCDETFLSGIQKVLNRTIRRRTKGFIRKRSLSYLNTKVNQNISAIIWEKSVIKQFKTHYYIWIYLNMVPKRWF